MRVFLYSLVLVQAFMMVGFANADATSEQRWTKELVSKDVTQIRRAAQEMLKSGAQPQALLDVVAEVILETYDVPPTGYIHQDALAYAANVIGASGNGRYHDILVEVENNANHKKLRKFAKKNRKKLDGEGVAQYKKGGVSLKALRAK